MFRFAKLLTRCLSLCCLIAWCSAQQAFAGTLSEDFSGSSATLQWQVYGNACLTAGSGAGTIPACASGTAGGLYGNTPDAAGSGALLLTRTGTYELGGVISQASFSSSTGFSVTVKTVAYGGTGADGISIFLLDASQPIPAALGWAGGGLAYDGLQSGYLGIGLDEYGNFSVPGCSGGSCVGGTGFSANTVALRGPTSTQNSFITNTVPGFALWSNVATRTSATPHTYKIDMNADGLISVTIDGITYISNFDASAVTGQIPARLRIGIAASTGGATNIHEILSISASTINIAALNVTKKSYLLSDPVDGTSNPKAIPGATIRYCIIASNPAGNPVASGVAVSDALGNLPVSFVPGTIMVNGTAPGGNCAWDGAPGGTYSGTTVSGTLANLAGGTALTMYFDAKVK